VSERAQEGGRGARERERDALFHAPPSGPIDAPKTAYRIVRSTSNTSEAPVCARAG